MGYCVLIDGLDVIGMPPMPTRTSEDGGLRIAVMVGDLRKLRPKEQ